MRSLPPAAVFKVCLRSAVGVDQQHLRESPRDGFSTSASGASDQ